MNLLFSLFLSLNLLFTVPNVIVGVEPIFFSNDEFNTKNNSQVCPTVQNTPFFSVYYGTVTLNGLPAPTGSIIKAYSPRNDLVGCFITTTAGNYGMMYVYGEDTSVSPAIPGMRVDEVTTFTINDLPVSATPSQLWKNDKDLHNINITSIGVSADFIASPLSGASPLNVQFTDTSSGAISSWLWTFGDGQTSVERNPQHVYVTPGVYTVSLTIQGMSGSDSEVKTNFVTVSSAVNANFIADKTSGVAPLNVNFTNNSTGDLSAQTWNFGDGGESSAINPSYTYVSSGVYTVSLTVSGSGGTDIETKNNYITVYDPVVANFSMSSSTGIAPASISFGNLSTGDYSSLEWDFGDGYTSTLPNPVHVYSAKGNYTVRLTASGAGGSHQKTASVEIFAPVVANFDATPRTGNAPLLVLFTNMSTGDYLSLNWTFGDGESSTEVNPAHTYINPGVYTVSLTATGNGGANISTQTDLISVSDGLSADFTCAPSTGIAPLTVQFTDKSEGQPSTWLWTFGDGSSSTDQNPQHTFWTGGEYQISLTVTNLSGSDTYAFQLNVLYPIFLPLVLR